MERRGGVGLDVSEAPPPPRRASSSLDFISRDTSTTTTVGLWSLTFIRAKPGRRLSHAIASSVILTTHASALRHDVMTELAHCVIVSWRRYSASSMTPTTKFSFIPNRAAGETHGCMVSELCSVTEPAENKQKLYTQRTIRLHICKNR